MFGTKLSFLNLAAIFLFSIGVPACADTEQSDGETEGKAEQALQGPGTVKFYITSEANGMGVNAWGGAVDGAQIRLHQACNSSNPDCEFFVDSDHMIRSVRNPALALNAWGGAKEGAQLVLTTLCTPSNPDCLWNYNLIDHTFAPLNDQSLMVNAWFGAAHGTFLKLTRACTSANANCRWGFQPLL